MIKVGEITIDPLRVIATTWKTVFVRDGDYPALVVIGSDWEHEIPHDPHKGMDCEKLEKEIWKAKQEPSK